MEIRAESTRERASNQSGVGKVPILTIQYIATATPSHYSLLTTNNYKTACRLQIGAISMSLDDLEK